MHRTALHSALALTLSAAFIFPSIATAQKATRPAVPPKVAASLAKTQPILREVSKLRELPIKRPVTAGYRSRADLERDLIQDFDESLPPAEAAAQTKMLVALALVPKDFKLREEMLKLLTEQVAGFYRPKTGEFVLTESTSSNDADEQETVIAHELTHALQDQHFNLKRFDKPMKGQGDRDLAIHALIEGDATVVMIVYGLDGSTKILDLPFSLTDLMMSEMKDDPKKTPALAAAPKALKQTLLFPYAGGAGFVQALVKQGGWARVSQAFTDLPESTEQILHPEKYLAGERPIQVTVTDPGKVLGGDWKEVTRDVNGEFGYRLILGEFLDEAESKRAAAGWGGDASVLFENAKTGELFLVQHTVWDTSMEAAEFFDAYTSRTVKRYPAEKINAPTRLLRTIGNVRVERVDNEVVILEGIPAGADANALAAHFFKQDRKSRPTRPKTGEKNETGRR
jgi:hypothetical protein